MEERRENNGSGFWLGLIVGAVAAGLAVYLLDKEDKETLVKNLKKDWDSVSQKIKDLVEEPLVEEDEETGEPVVEEEELKEKPVGKKKPLPKFFKKNGKKVKPILLRK